METDGKTWPKDLVVALTAAPAARATFFALPPSHRREYLEWINEAKRSETRRRRIKKTIEMLHGNTS